VQNGSAESGRANTGGPHAGAMAPLMEKVARGARYGTSPPGGVRGGR
jgi:hypothetical protein